MKRELTVRQPLPEKRFEFHDLDAVLAAALDKNPATTQFTETEREAARARLKAMRQVMTPVTKQELRNWVLPIVGGCQNPRPDEELLVWLEILHVAMSDVPRGLFTMAKQRWALRHIKFFPTPADVWDVIKDDWGELTTHHGRLVMIANG